jgi:hypothetical protein
MVQDETPQVVNEYDTLLIEAWKMEKYLEGVISRSRNFFDPKATPLVSHRLGKLHERVRGAEKAITDLRILLETAFAEDLSVTGERSDT